MISLAQPSSCWQLWQTASVRLPSLQERERLTWLPGQIWFCRGQLEASLQQLVPGHMISTLQEPKWYLKKELTDGTVLRGRLAFAFGFAAFFAVAVVVGFSVEDFLVVVDFFVVVVYQRWSEANTTSSLETS